MPRIKHILIRHTCPYRGGIGLIEPRRDFLGELHKEEEASREKGTRAQSRIWTVCPYDPAIEAGNAILRSFLTADLVPFSFTSPERTDAV